MININDDTQENIQEILKRHFSRIPVYDDDKDKIIGVLHTKRLLAAGFNEGFDNIVLRKILQEPLFVPETIFVDDLLRQLRNTQNQMAILLDEYGGVAGIVTLEDLLEEIVGEIHDEYDENEEDFVHKISDKEYLVEGSVNLDDFNDHLELNLESEEYDSLGGFIIEHLDRLPELGDSVTTSDGIRLVVESLDKNRIEKVHVYLPEKVEYDEDSEE